MLTPSQSPDAASARERIKAQMLEMLALEPDALLKLNELHCAEPDCPDVETVALLFLEGRVVKAKAPLALRALEQSDVLKLCADLKTALQEEERDTV